MGWFDLILLTIYLQAFIWYGRLSYVQGVLDRHYAPQSERVRHVLGEETAARWLRRLAGRPFQRTSR
jgi:hypothetical protein